MTEFDLNAKIDEVDRLLNDVDVRLEPARVWSLLAEVAQFSKAASKAPPYALEASVSPLC